MTLIEDPPIDISAGAYGAIEDAELVDFRPKDPRPWYERAWDTHLEPQWNQTLYSALQRRSIEGLEAMVELLQITEPETAKPHGQVAGMARTFWFHPEITFVPKARRLTYLGLL
jgi:hypothetical protein